MKKTRNTKIASILILLIIIGCSYTASAYTNCCRCSDRLIIKQPLLYIICDNKIYYVSINDWMIYSINLSSGKRQNIYSSEVCEEGILLCRNNIYFKNKSDSALYSMDKSGGEIKKVSDGVIGRKYEGFISVNDEIVYYDINNMPHRIGNEALSSIEAETYKITSISSKYNNGFLYYFDEGGLKSCDTKNGYIRKLADDNVYSIVNIDKEFAYYVDSGNYNLNKISVSGGKNYKLIDNKLVSEGPDFNYGNVQFIDGKIYYISYDVPEKPALYYLSTANNKKEIIKRNVTDFRIYGEDLFYISSGEESKLHYMNLKDMKDEVIDSRDTAYLIDILQGYILYSVKSDDCSSNFGELYAAGLQGKKFELK